MVTLLKEKKKKKVGNKEVGRVVEIRQAVAHVREVVAIVVWVSGAGELCHTMEMVLHLVPVTKSIVAE